MFYKGFLIKKIKRCMYRIICFGSVLGTAKNVQSAQEYIDELIYQGV